MINLSYLVVKYADILKAPTAEKKAAGVYDLQFVHKTTFDVYKFTSKYPFLTNNKIHRLVYNVNIFKYFAVDYVANGLAREIKEVIPNHGYETKYI